MSLLLAAVAPFSIIPVADLPQSAADPCVARADVPGVSPPRKMTIDDLVELADIGRSDPNETPSPFGLSPDNKRVAFAVRRANAATNSYCERLLVMPLDASEAPRELDRGGDFPRDDFRLRDFPSVVAGWAKVSAPRWSPDGRRIAFLKRMAGSRQVWLVEDREGGTARQATTMPDDIDEFAWLPDGKGLVVATRPGIRLAAEEIARKARSGFLYDKTISPQFSERPMPMGDIAPQYTTIALESGSVRASSAVETAILTPSQPSGRPENARGLVAGPEGWSAWLEPKFPERFISPTRLVLSGPDGKRLNCSAPECEGILRMWWSDSERALFAVQKSGWGQAGMAILRWDAGAPEPRRLVEGDVMLLGCRPAVREIICGREDATSPRRVVAVDSKTGSLRLIYDPNARVGTLSLGKAQRFRFRNAYGVESYADLVLPPDHRLGQRHPLIVVQYISHGFLRGGSGDEVPIQALAARGFAVLSFASPTYIPAVAEKYKTGTEVLRANRSDWLDQRSVQSSLDMALDQAIATGAVDSERIGLTGWSAGVSTAQFALINSPRYKAVSLGSCCEDMYSFALEAGPTFTDFARSIGYRLFEEDAEEFWRPMSLILNADRIDVPILIQNADSEYEGGLDVHEVFKQKGKPIELHIFENETHYKWQPAHRLAVYERTTEWFEFWLLKRRNCASDREPQYARWLAMKGAPTAAELTCTPAY